MAFGYCRLQQKVSVFGILLSEFVLGIWNMAIGLVSTSYTRTLGTKRVVVSNNVEASTPVAPLKRMCSGRITLNSECFPLEDLPQELLVKVLCGVDHEDLKQLFLVSKAIREATLVAKEMHFEFSTPKKNTFALRTPFNIEDANEFEEIEAPKAPRRKPMSSWDWGKLGDISVRLFPSLDDEL